MTEAGGPRIAILDYGMGNLRSVEKALERAGATPVRTRDHDEIRTADGAVLPGVGAFPKAMANLRELEFDVLLKFVIMFRCTANYCQEKERPLAPEGI